MRDGNDWTLVLAEFPPTDRPLEFIRREWDKPVVMRWIDMHPAMNVADLYWRDPDKPRSLLI